MQVPKVKQVSLVDLAPKAHLVELDLLDLKVLLDLAVLWVLKAIKDQLV